MDHRQYLLQKIINRDQLIRKINLWKFSDDKVVFTNGVFDLLHAGHVDYLAAAASLGTKLIVGINDDVSVGRLKGKSRPINPQDARCMVLAALGFVDVICLFEEDTPLELIKIVKPAVLVKGADYKESEIAGADFVKEYGGEVKTIELIKGLSSSILIDKIRLT